MTAKEMEWREWWRGLSSLSVVIITCLSPMCVSQEPSAVAMEMDPSSSGEGV